MVFYISEGSSPARRVLPTIRVLPTSHVMKGDGDNRSAHAQQASRSPSHRNMATDRNIEDRSSWLGGMVAVTQEKRL